MGFLGIINTDTYLSGKVVKVAVYRQNTCILCFEKLASKLSVKTRSFSKVDGKAFAVPQASKQT